MLVEVHDNHVGRALRVRKKWMNREGVFRELRQREAFEPPSQRRQRR
jgi:small subunit ribosomal protein S21